MEKEPDGASEIPKLCATAALVRGAINAPEVPESVQSQARAAALARLEEQWRHRPGPAHPSRAWPSRLGSWLQVAFNLIRRR